MYSAGCGLLLLPGFGYRAFLAACSIPSAILLVGRFCWRYESPKYLVAKGALAEAEKLFADIAKINGSDQVRFELSTEKQEKSSSSSFKGYWGMIALASIAFFCQTSAYYGLTLWLSLFLRPWDVSPSQMLLLIGLAEIPGLIVTSLHLKYFKNNRVLLAVNFAAASVLSLFIYLVKDTLSFVVSFCALYFYIVSIWTIL